MCRITGIHQKKKKKKILANTDNIIYSITCNTIIITCYVQYNQYMTNIINQCFVKERQLNHNKI